MHDHGDEQFVTAVAPEHYHSHSPYVLKQLPNAYSYPANSYYSAAAAASPPVASSPETRMSVSGSSTGSYSIPHANFDPAIPHPEQTSVPATNGRPQASPQLLPPSRPVTGVIAESYSKEGQTRASWSPRMSSSDGHNPRSHHEAQNTVTVYTSDKEQVSRREPNAVLVLLLFSAPIPVFSMGTAIYTFFALFIVIFTSPLRLCPPTRFFRSTTFSTQLCQLLAPALRYHERLAQSSRSDHRYHHSHHPYTPETSTEQFAPLWSSLVLTLAPFLSFGLLLAAWTAAFFWIFAMILGNPDGTEKKDDGRVAVLGVNAWWQTWLRKSRRRQ
ncbi:hypothetical protein BGW36DRAFT_393313 [Talaromyces proteolyticus]|uniref:Uncharacterized protein n=1 Tax=Talaromyces proteolyticus TaxID=1131652 RepID=A0AAD4L1F1_9EURO|nr:uncharacterized protein BGW36DRAFT_393313 [Talaromyces proteolyticus]KAH8705797.1 hypothetical protein BGW36DRAFT_393313 [Talaromyces proteolyticus]